MIKPTYYIYLHIRPDKNEVFYVGRGKSASRGSPVRRAYIKTRRSKQWESIVNKNNGQYKVEIVEWCNTLDEILKKEIEYIDKFGMQIDGSGTLINLTRGGDGSLGLKHTDEAKIKMSMIAKNDKKRLDRIKSPDFEAKRLAGIKRSGGAMLGKKHTEQTKMSYKEARKGEKNNFAKKVVHLPTGKTFGCVEDAANFVGKSKKYLYQVLTGRAVNKVGLEYVNGV